MMIWSLFPFFSSFVKTLYGGDEIEVTIVSGRALLEVKKGLVSFLKKEYREKKPLHIKLIQVKPHISFKKGTMLPNLIIKSLQQAAYVILVDYKSEYRIYFFTKSGQSMGGSTIQDVKKVDKELKGLGKTLYQLPKPDPFAHVDVKTERIREKFADLCKRYSSETSQTIKPKYPLSVIRYHQGKTPQYRPFRFGIVEKKGKNNVKMLLMEEKYCGSEWEDIILVREMILHHPDMDSIPKLDDLEPIHAVATMYAMGSVFGNKWKEITNVMETFSSSSPVCRKLVQWLKVFGKQLSSSNDSQKAKKFGKFVFSLFSELKREKDSLEYEIKQIRTLQGTLPDFNSIFLLWIMQEGYKKGKKWEAPSSPLTRSRWGRCAVIHYVLSHESLFAKYGLNTDFDALKPLLWYSMISHMYRLRAQGTLPWKLSSRDKEEFIMDLRDSTLTRDKQAKSMEGLQALDIMQFFSISRKSYKPSMGVVKQMIREILAKQALSVKLQIPDSFGVNIPRKIVGKISNQSSLDLKDFILKISCRPPHRATIRNIKTHKQHLDSNSKYPFTFSFVANGTGTIHVTLSGEYRSLLYEKEKKDLLLLEQWQWKIK